MVASPPLPLPLPSPSRPAGTPDPSAGLSGGWALLHEGGAAIADIAQLARETAGVSPRDFAMRAAAAGPARLALIERGIDDCAAALHCGLTALMTAAEQGRDCTAAALTLWREFDRARTGLLALSAPTGRSHTPGA